MVGRFVGRLVGRLVRRWVLLRVVWLGGGLAVGGRRAVVGWLVGCWLVEAWPQCRMGLVKLEAEGRH